MTDRLAATALRLMAPRARPLGPGDHDSLQNIITDILPNGALCWVNSNETLYVLKKLSTAAPVGDAIIKPLAGPGRWFALVGAILEQFSFYIGLTSTIDIVVPAPVVWTILSDPTATWTTDDVVKGAGGVTNTEFWSVATPGPGILTYSGPSGLFLVEADATIFTTPAFPPIQADIYLSKNGAFIGSPAPLVRQSRAQMPSGTANHDIHLHIASRLTMAATDTVQLLVRVPDGVQDLNLSFVQLYVSPLF